MLREDDKDGQTYACIAQNKVMRRIEQGEYAVVRPQGGMYCTEQVMRNIIYSIYIINEKVYIQNILAAIA